MKQLHHLEAKNLRFSVFSSKNIKELSVAKVITPMLFDQLGHALPGGLYDPKMGKFLQPFRKPFDPKLMDLNVFQVHSQ